MSRFFRSLLVLLVVAALGATTFSAALALPCAGHDQESYQDNVRAAPLVLHGDSTAGPMAPCLAHHHPFEGKCPHPCCFPSAGLVLAGVFRPVAALRMPRVTFAFPGDRFLAAITVAPLTGPPRNPA